MEHYLKALQKGVVYFTLFIISLLLILVLVDVFINIYDGLKNTPFREFIEMQYPHLINLFLLIIIGVELIEAIKGFLMNAILQVELVLLIAIIAVSRKVIVMGISKHVSQELLSLAAMLVALALSYFIITMSKNKQFTRNNVKEDSMPNGLKSESNDSIVQ